MDGFQSLFLPLLTKSYLHKELCILYIVGEIDRTGQEGSDLINPLVSSGSTGKGARECIIPIYKFIF